MAAAVLLRSVARKMSRAAAPTHHRSLIARALHGGARSRPANSNQVQQGTADALVSAGMAAATGLRSGAGWLTTKMAHAPPPPPPPPYHRLVHGRGIHSRTSPDPIPSTPQKVLHTTALDKATAGVAYIALFGAAIYMHFWVKPALDEVTAMFEDLPGHGNKTQKGTGVIDKLGKEEAVKTMHSQENHVKELETTIMDLEAEIAELKIALDSSRSQGKV